MRTLAGFLCKFLPGIVIAILLLSLPTQGYAQTSSASLSVTITDPSGAMVSDANVVIRNSDTNQEQRVHSGKSGTVSFSFLKPGRYSLAISKERFSDIAVDNIVLSVGDQRTLQQVLKIGSAQESVTVDGSGPTINTTDGSVGTVVRNTFVANLPLNGRSFQDLILLTPGIVTQSPQSNPAVTLGNNGDFSVNGQRAESNSYIVDGVSANSSASFGSVGAAAGGNIQSSTALGTTQSLVSVDALQEFRVNSSSYSAEYGRTPGGQFSFVTRSGTDNFHGSVFDYLRNNYFDANNWFTDYYHTPAPALRQNDFGGTLGGPITIPGLYKGHGRSFFFASYEGLRLMQPQPAVLEYVPSLALRQNALLPAVMRPILNAFPLPTVGGIDYGTGLAQFIQSDSLPSQIDSTSVRVDQTVTSKVRLFFRFSDTPSSSTARNLSVFEPTTSGSQTYTLGATTQFNASLSDEFRLGYVDSNGQKTYTMDNFGGAQPIDFASALGLKTSVGGGVGPGPDLALSLGGNYTFLSLTPASGKMHQWNITDALSWLRGKHNIKVGVDYRYIETIGSSEPSSVFYLYTNQSQILTNKASSSTASINIPKVVPVFHEFSAFAQDEWKLRPRLSLSLGLRWDVNPPPTSGSGPLPYTLTGSLSEPSTLELAPIGTPMWKTTWYNIAPRLGVAWVANSDAHYQTVLRAGGGVFFDTGNQTGALGFSSSPGRFASQPLANAPIPFPNIDALAFSIAPPYTNTVVYAPYSHLQLPYTLEWSAAVEQGFGQAQTLTISYVASNGRRLIQENEFSITALNPQFGTIAQYTNGPTSNYQSLQTKFQRSVARGVQALVSYTWSHALDYGSNFFTLPLQRGNSDFDVRNNFTGGATWESPKVNRGHILNTILNTWAVDGHVIARSGFPVNVVGNEGIDSATGAAYFGGVNLVPNQPVYLYIKGLPGGREVNPAAFHLPAAGQNGNAPRNFVRGFGATQVNLALRRDLRLRDDLNLQFRAESFNVLNHPTFGTIATTLTSSTFGQATTTLNQSLATTNSLYQMGGPRSMQFALKLQF